MILRHLALNVGKSCNFVGAAAAANSSFPKCRASLLLKNQNHKTGLLVSVATRYASSTTTSTKKPEEIQALWQQADAVCFDVDCTLTTKDGLDSLATFLGKGQAVQDLTNLAMNGTMELEEALQKRLEIMAPSVQDIADWIKAHPGESRLAPGVVTLLEALRERNKEVYLISGGFRELILPVSDYLQVPRSNIYANRFIFTNSEEDTSSFYPNVKVSSFDTDEPTSRDGGKPEAIRQIRAANADKIKTVVMVGDGITDLEAIQEEGGADLFVGYGGVVVRDIIKKNADWFIMDYEELTKALP
ncbi:hypothetical protein ACA910_001521 [Epithemia clementina (nom. ined.)]